MSSKKNDDFEISHSMVHYLLSIHKLKETKGYARITDIAKSLGLTKGSVSTAINNLKKRELVQEEEDSKFLLLTDLGHDQVHKILSARTLLFYFLRDFVGVSEKTAEEDSCKMEHLISSETSEKFFDFMKKVSCMCSEKSDLDIKSGIDLCSYETVESFIKEQKGDTYLSAE